VFAKRGSNLYRDGIRIWDLQGKGREKRKGIQGECKGGYRAFEFEKEEGGEGLNEGKEREEKKGNFIFRGGFSDLIMGERDYSRQNNWGS